MPDRVLVIANELITNARQSLPKSLRQNNNHAREVLVIAPMLTTRLQSLTSDIDAAHHAARQRLRHIAADMSTFRTPPLTTIGDENQLLAVADALATFDADACVVVTHTPEHANYHEHGVPEQIHEQFRLPTTTLTVDVCLSQSHRSGSELRLIGRGSGGWLWLAVIDGMRSGPTGRVEARAGGQRGSVGRGRRARRRG